MSRAIYIIGNWKMNQSLNDIQTFFQNFNTEKQNYKCHTWIAPQAIHAQTVKELGKEYNILAGAQNCSNEKSGAFTGETSPYALKDMEINFTLIGHSERRQIFKESDKLLNEKTKKALDAGLTVVFCIGETLEERESNQTAKVLTEQLNNGLLDLTNNQMSKVIIAYEPVWAIGTGKTATPKMAQDTHKVVRDHLAEKGFNAEEISILYGGSVKPSNVEELLSQKDIDGALVGGASLQGQDFTALCNAGNTCQK